MKKLGFGCMRLPIVNDDYGVIDLEKVNDMIDLFISRGFTYFDTAYLYHSFNSELAVAESLVKRYPRHAFQLATKMPMFLIKTEADLERIFNEQLKKCGVDFFDYYLLHNISGQFYHLAEQVKAFDFIVKKKAEGKIKHIGFSIHDSAEVIDDILTKHQELDFVQIQLNYLDWNNEGVQSRKCYEVCVKHKKPVIVMEPIKGGTLINLPDDAIELMKNVDSEASIASWAIRYAASLENVMMVLSGMSNLEQVEDNTTYMKNFKVLTEAEQTLIQQVTTILNERIAIPCTACRYCVEEKCPKNIAIPEYFAIYNAEKQETKQGFTSQGVYFNSLHVTHGKASDCIGCGKCERICPQHLPIRSLLNDVAHLFETNKL